LLKSADLGSKIFGNNGVFLESREQNRDDILILDIQMPGMNGCNLMEYPENRKLHLNVIVVTTNDENKSRECSLNYGAMAHFTKPDDSGLLLDAIINKTKTFY
jgi:FixJ family two-component response regulator